MIYVSGRSIPVINPAAGKNLLAIVRLSPGTFLQSFGFLVNPYRQATITLNDNSFIPA